MLADVSPEIALPHRLAVVVKGSNPIMLRVIPHDIDALTIDGGRSGGEGVILVFLEQRERKGLLPQHLAVRGTDTQHEYLARLLVRASEENLLAPQNGRGMIRTGHRNLPIEISVRPFSWDGLCLTDASAVRPAKARPLLRSRGESNAENQQC